MDLRYPIGKLQAPEQMQDADRHKAIANIAEAPKQFRAAVAGLHDAQLDTPYREGGWTVRQVIHHVADSHMNAYVRTRLALTEQEPTIKPYDEKLWAELEDARSAPLESSHALLDALHERWVRLLRATRPADFSRTFRHPEHGLRTVDWMLGVYDWHGRHHVAHIKALRERHGWT
ncbi:MAG TPA: putative metal-dependent hydrolase [Candidatus Dormibacteraeota bacterium]|nr:putative metal-dependent hydrolase [Candidatus Dormibacteraeota bacterium]